jgi:hypothetical protein
VSYTVRRDEGGLHLDLWIPGDWERINLIREAVARCVAAVFGDVELKEALAMVSAELLENAVKYGIPGTGVNVSVHEDGESLVVDVTNQVQDARHVDALRHRLDWLRGFADPSEAYMAAMADIYAHAEARPQGQEGGLGLVRVSYEGGCRVDCDTSETGKITVRARCARPASLALGA